MKYREFKTEVRKMGFYIGYSQRYLFVIDRNGDKFAGISKELDMWLDTEYEEFPKLPQEQRAGLFDLLYELAKTPLTEREEEKRYWLQRIEPPILGEQDPRYLFYTRVGGYYDIGTTKSEWRNVIKTILTESEIAEMDITGFEKIEVTP